MNIPTALTSTNAGVVPGVLGRLHLFLAFSVLVSWPASVAAESTDRLFLEGLRQRRLFYLTESYCQQRLADSTLGDDKQIDMAIDLSRTFAQHALHSVLPEREVLWQRAASAIQVLETRYSHHPRFVLAQVQQALVVLAEGELARQEWEMDRGSAISVEASRDKLRQAIQLLQAVQNEVVRKRRQPSTSEERFSDQQLLSLQKHISYQWARALRNQGLSYPEESADRVHALTQALEQLLPLAQLSLDQSVAWPSRIDQIVCYRLLGKSDLARTQIDAVIQQRAPVDVQLQALAERMRIALAEGELRQALDLAEPDQLVGKTGSADFDLASLESFVAAWRASTSDPVQADRWQNRIAAKLDELGKVHGPYWKRRGGMLLTRVASDGIDPDNLELLVQTAQNFYVSGQWNESVQAYDQAARHARDLGDNDRSFRLSYSAAQIREERQDLVEAMKRFRELSSNQPTHPRAGDVHLQAVWMAAERARQQQSGALEDYIALLNEHLEYWPHASSSDTARWWLGRLKEHIGDWSAAVIAYRDISMDFASHKAAIRAADRCWMRWLDERRSAGEDVGAEASAAVKYFDRIIVGSDSRLPERWSPSARAAVLASVRLQLRFLEPDLDCAEAFLGAALGDRSNASIDWLSKAQTLLVVLLARQGRMREAKSVFSEISNSSPSAFLNLLQVTSQLAAESAPDIRRQIADLQLDVTSSLADHLEELTARQRGLMFLTRAQALAAVGQRAEALEILATLSAQNPREAGIQEAYARLLLDAQDRASWERARDKWREVAVRCRPKTPRWYRAKYSLALAHYRLGDPSRAAEILRLVQAIPPGFQGTSLAPEFTKLLEMVSASEPAS